MHISIIIPVYNAEPFLRKSVESALQFSEVSEVILVEDRSPDNALQLCQQLATEDARVKVFTHPNNENRGAGASRNLGIEKATGDFIAFLDADDYYLPNRFDAEKELFKNPEVDGVYGALGVHYYSEKAKETFMNQFRTKGNADEVLTTVSGKPYPGELFEVMWGFHSSYSGYFTLDTLTLRQEVLKKEFIHFSELRLHQDTEFLYRIAHNYRLYPGITDRAIAKRGVHEENRITGEKDEVRKHRNRFLMFDKMLEWGQKEKISQKYIDFFKENRFYHLFESSNSAERRKMYFNALLFDRAVFSKNNIEHQKIHFKVFDSSMLNRINSKIAQIILNLDYKAITKTNT